jgi:hypothetical protein
MAVREPAVIAFWLPPKNYSRDSNRGVLSKYVGIMRKGIDEERGGYRGIVCSLPFK